MASLKPSLPLDNNSFEYKKLCFSLGSLNFASISSCSGYVITNGAFSGRPFCKLKQIRVSRLETEILDSSESNLDDFTIDNLKKCVVGEDSLILESQENFEDTHRRRVNIWKKFRGPKNSRNTKRKPVIRRNVNIYKGLEEKSIVVSDRVASDNVLDSNTAVDIEFGNVGPKSSPVHCNVILRQLEKTDDSKALRFFEWMRLNGKLKQNVTAYNLVLRILGRKSDWNGAEGMVMAMVNEAACELNYQTFNTLIYACNKRGLVDTAARWFRMMLEMKVRPNVATFGMLMSLYQKGWIVEEAEFTFSQMRNLKIVCESAYSAMITIYTRMGLYEKAEDVISFLGEDEVTLNLENWLVVLNAYCQQGKVRDAENVFCAMKETGFPPNIVAYNTMITGYGKGSCMDNAERLFCILKEDGLEPDETTYRSLIEGWGRAGNYQQARFYYSELQKLGFRPNSSNLYTLINLQAKHEEEECAKRTIDDMLMIGCQKSSILGIVLQAYEKANRLDKVPSILGGSMYDHVCKNQTSCAILVTDYVKNCLIDNALKVLREKQWVDTIFEENLYHLLICSCKDLGYLDEATRIFNSMPKPDKPNLNIVCTMIDIYGSRNLFSEAEKLYADLKASGVKLDMIAFSIIIRMYVKSNSLHKACAVLDIMNGQKEIVPDVYLLRDMLRIYQRCGMQRELVDLYYKLLKKDEIWDEEMYNCVINCCAGALPVDELSRLLDEMLMRGFAPSTITFNVMLNAYGKSRLFERARKLFWLAKKRGLVDVISYNTIIAAYGKNRYLKNMSAAVRKMQFDGFSISLEAYNCMLDVYGKEREMEKFRSVLQRMKDSNCGSDHYTYNIQINIYGEQGWIDEVADVLMELEENGIQPDLCCYNTLIKAYGIAGKIEDAVALVREMRDRGIEPDRITYTNLIAAMKKNDKFLEAVKWSLWMKQMRL